VSAMRPATLGLLAALALLAAVIGWQVNREVPVPVSASAATQRTGALPAVPQLVVQLPPVNAFSDIVERPLFVETRRPPAPEADVSVSNKEPAPQWNLVGTALTEGDRAALLFDARNRKFLVMRTGTRQAGWELADIQADGVVLEKGKAKHQIKLPRF